MTSKYLLIHLKNSTVNLWVLSCVWKDIKKFPIQTQDTEIIWSQCDQELMQPIKYHAMNTYGGVEVLVHTFLTFALDSTDDMKLERTQWKSGCFTQQKNQLPLPELNPNALFVQAVAYWFYQLSNQKL